MLFRSFNIPAGAKPGEYKFTIDAEGEDAKSSLPVTVNLAEPLAAKLTATPKFPVLKGSPKSNFDFNVAVKNEASADATVQLRADGLPAGFTATFKEGYNTQEITSLVIKANESKDITIAVKPSPRAGAGLPRRSLHVQRARVACTDEGPNCHDPVRRAASFAARLAMITGRNQIGRAHV